jgi:hypothetical protein
MQLITFGLNDKIPNYENRIGEIVDIVRSVPEYNIRFTKVSTTCLL